MSEPLHPTALFRLSVLGPLASRGDLQHGEVKKIVRELASKTYHIPGSCRVHLSEQAILRWYYAWKRGGIKALCPVTRVDKGKSKLSDEICNALIAHKKDNPARSINTLIYLLEQQGIAAKKTLSRATVHRFLKEQQLSERILNNHHQIERRSFEAKCAGDIWQGDVLHGPRVQTSSGLKKTYLVSLLDDASRLIVHSAFCLGETALDIEGVLKQAVLRRGLPHKLILDNGPAYRSGSLQEICALLEIRLVYCRPYEPEGKGKLERFHRTFRSQFLEEINLEKITSLDDLNHRLWAWLEEVYHQAAHEGLQGKKPIERWREDLVHVRSLGPYAEKIDTIFLHRIKRLVRRDGTLAWDGKMFEVPYECANQKVVLVFDPHANKALSIESLKGKPLGGVSLLDRHENLNRTRQRPQHSIVSCPKGKNAIDLALEKHQRRYNYFSPTTMNDEEV